MQKLTYFLFLFCFFGLTSLAQDKLFLRNGSVLYCKIASINDKTLSYKDTIANASVITISKETIMMVEFKSGEIYVFGKTEAKTNETGNSTSINETREQRKERKMQEWKKEEEALGNNIIGIEPAGFFVGRYGISYERLLANKSIGIKIPIILSYNYLSAMGNSNGINNGNGNSTTTTGNQSSFVTGLDVNFYQDIKPNTKYFFGPRFRYGKDAFLGGVEGFTAQLNNGIFASQGKTFTNTFGVGIGFFKLLNTFTSNSFSNYSDKQFYPSFSLTWRLGFRL